MYNLTSVEDDRDRELFYISQQLENVRPDAVLPRHLQGAWIAHPARSVDIRSPVIVGSREAFIMLRRQLCGHHTKSSVYKAARHAIELRIAKLSDLAMGDEFEFSNRVHQRVGHEGKRRQERLRKALKAYSWNTSAEFLHASRERSSRWQAENSHLQGREHPFAEFDAAVLDLLRLVIDDEKKARNRRRSVFTSVEKKHRPIKRTIRNALLVDTGLIDVEYLIDYLVSVSFFGAFNACDIYLEYSELRTALEVIAFLGEINLGIANPSSLQAYTFLVFMQKYERWVDASDETCDVDCEVVNAVSSRFRLTEHFAELEDLCMARLKTELYGTEPATPRLRYWAMI